VARRVVLHIGPRKTATTYLQRVLQRCVEDAAIPATAYPLRTRGRVDHNHVPGLIDLARSRGEISLQEDAWTHQDGSDARALLDAVSSADGDVILSAEALSVLRASGAAAVVTALAPAPVDVVITARDLGRVLPSSWQQHMRNGNFEAYDDYLALRSEERTSRKEEAELGRGFWRAYRYGQLARRWAQVARSACVVTVPASGADVSEIWRRFREAAVMPGLPEQPPAIDLEAANISLTAAESMALQGLNLVARREGEGRREVRAWQRLLIRRGWTERPDRGPRLGLPEDMVATVRAWAEEDRADLAASGIRIIGSLDDLSVSTQTPGMPDAAAVAEAAGAAILLMLRGPRRDA